MNWKEAFSDKNENKLKSKVWDKMFPLLRGIVCCLFGMEKVEVKWSYEEEYLLVVARQHAYKRYGGIF